MAQLAHVPQSVTSAAPRGSSVYEEREAYPAAKCPGRDSECIALERDAIRMSIWGTRQIDVRYCHETRLVEVEYACGVAFHARLHESSHSSAQAWATCDGAG